MFNWFIEQFITLPTSVLVQDTRKDYRTQCTYVPVDIPLVPLNYWEEDLTMVPEPYLADHVMVELREVMPEVIMSWVHHNHDGFTEYEIEEELQKWRIK